jgi:multidrug resistance efflux pump
VTRPRRRSTSVAWSWDTIVRAPITGMVGNMAAEIGQNVNTGTRLAVIGDPSAMRVRVTLTERMLTYIPPAQAFTSCRSLRPTT